LVFSRSSLRSAGWIGRDSVSAQGETALLRQLMELAGEPPADVVVGPGDDAAAWRGSASGLVLWSTDTICENVDFRRRHQTPYQVGWKAWMAAVSDLSAMGATPRGGLVAALVPEETSTEALHAIQLGLVEAAAVDGALVMGGDLSRTPGPLALTVTVGGEITDGSPVILGGGSAGDRIVVTGALGMAAAALQLLEEGSDRIPQDWLDRLLVPPSRVETGKALRRAGVSAMTDLSDGLLLDLARICQESGVGADLWLDRLPLGRGLEDTGRATELALTGGEDFELLATIPESLVGGITRSWKGGLPPLAVVGRLTIPGGTHLFREQGGDPIDAPAAHGFRHF
jgi:thiamine-monophosphate kinase